MEDAKGNSLEGLWVLLVPENGIKRPMLARAGDGLYLLAFKTGFSARKFLQDSQATPGTEPRMVVSANRPEIVASVTQDVAGILVDYDLASNTYRAASSFN